ncbi:hypothetical protein ACHQM5_020804 [Ranunculus cassubicifolius]
MEPQSRRKASKSNIAKHFSIQEDENICRAWMACIVVAYSKKGLWERVLDRFNKLMGSVTNRTLASLMSRWSTIHASVNKFCGCLEQLERANLGGTTQEKMKWAKVLYASGSEPFRFESCWRLVKDMPLFAPVRTFTNQSAPMKQNSSVKYPVVGASRLGGNWSSNSSAILRPARPMLVPPESKSNELSLRGGSIENPIEIDGETRKRKIDLNMESMNNFKKRQERFF